MSGYCAFKAKYCCIIGVWVVPGASSFIAGYCKAMADTDLASARRALRATASAGDARFLQGYFRTGPGEYGAGDRFLGVRVPAVRAVARAHRALPRKSVEALLRSRWHEERLLALLILVDQHRRADASGRAAIRDLYLAHTRHINNWDLVDSS